jgi:hypothetical protein
MQNSLERIFEGLEATLRDVVAPTITDSYILTQITSVAEIVGNLASRVEWRSDHLLDVSVRVRPILEKAGGPLPAMPSSASSNAELLQSRDDHLAALGQVQRSLETVDNDEVEALIREFLAWQVAFEMSLLRTSGRPKK